MGIRETCLKCGIEVFWFRLRDGICHDCGTGLAREQAIAAAQATAGAPISCPLCGATILEEATKCEFCGSILSAHSERKPAVAVPKVPADNLGNLLIAIPAFSTLVIWLGIYRLSILQRPLLWLLAVCGTTIVVTTILAAFDTAFHRRSAKGNAAGRGPAFWFLVLLIFWPATYPVYLRQRRRRRSAPTSMDGTILVLAFLVSAAFVGFRIYSNSSALLNNAQPPQDAYYMRKL